MPKVVGDCAGTQAGLVEPGRNRSPERVRRHPAIRISIDTGDAAEVAFAYYQRWEHESGLDEIETHLRGGGGILRSRSSDLVEQEMSGVLLTHYAIRELMCRAADEADEDPDRISFIRTVRLVRRRIDDPAAFSLH
ncbi:hypothetical protein [Actinomadura sp. HBU206391]|uniref:hypothetical protein n=1 Tax=Actinomadura sp. HBU206391 TaxID=2731692 RepID=UPI0016502C13|nr:hypothetical protein [Actinomadura sp. HBU206391]